MLQAPDGKKFFMGFTDPIEHQKWVEKNRELPVFTLTFEDYVSMLFRNDGQGSEGVAMGVVINSYGANVVVPKEMFAGIMARRMGTFRTMLRYNDYREAVWPTVTEFKSGTTDGIYAKRDISHEYHFYF